MLLAMGFSTAAIIATTAASAAGRLMEASAAKKQAAAYNAAARTKEQIAETEASQLTQVSMANQRREQRNAAMHLSSARADAAAGNLLQEGSILRREEDLATRLEDDINNRAAMALREADHVRTQGKYDAWDLRARAKQSRERSRGALLSAGGTLFSGAMSAIDDARKK